MNSVLIVEWYYIQEALLLDIKSLGYTSIEYTYM